MMYTLKQWKITGNQPLENRANENVIDGYAKQFLCKSVFNKNSFKTTNNRANMKDICCCYDGTICAL